MNQRIHFKKITPVLVPGNKISMVNETLEFPIWGLYIHLRNQKTNRKTRNNISKHKN